jgi:hypothetical protein
MPSWVLPTLERYIEQRICGGWFITAVLENNLFNAVGSADEASLKGLKGIVTLIYCHVPQKCWGSKEKVKNWLNGVE